MTTYSVAFRSTDTAQAFAVEFTAEANVMDGYIQITDHRPNSEDYDPDRDHRPLRMECGPWGEDEPSMERADQALAEAGYVKVGDWSGVPGDQYHAVTVR